MAELICDADEDGDSVAFSSDDELMMGLACMKDATFRLYIKGKEDDIYTDMNECLSLWKVSLIHVTTVNSQTRGRNSPLKMNYYENFSFLSLRVCCVLHWSVCVCVGGQFTFLIMKSN